MNEDIKVYLYSQYFSICVGKYDSNYSLTKYILIWNETEYTVDYWHFKWRLKVYHHTMKEDVNYVIILIPLDSEEANQYVYSMLTYMVSN